MSYSEHDYFTCCECDNSHNICFKKKTEYGSMCEECYENWVEESEQAKADDENDYRRATGWV